MLGCPVTVVDTELIEIHPQEIALARADMKLEDTFEIVSRSIVAFISRGVTRAATEPAPRFPPIFGTGFIVHESGIVATNRHVIEAFRQVPRHPTSGESALAVAMFVPDARDNQKGQRLLLVQVRDFVVLSSFSSSGDWFGAQLPDLGFVRVKVRDVPALELATEDFYLRPGMDIATAGFPLGDVPLTMFGHNINQIMPMLRRGIVSSVFPFTGAPQPHGFTIDVMQQGGSSGSPIFRCDSPLVVGMMSSGLTQPAMAQSSEIDIALRLPTNISIAEESAHISAALATYLKQQPIDVVGVPPLDQLIKHDPSTEISWSAFRK